MAMQCTVKATTVLVQTRFFLGREKYGCGAPRSRTLEPEPAGQVWAGDRMQGQQQQLVHLHRKGQNIFFPARETTWIRGTSSVLLHSFVSSPVGAQARQNGI